MSNNYPFEGRNFALRNLQNLPKKLVIPAGLTVAVLATTVLSLFNADVAVTSDLKQTNSKEKIEQAVANREDSTETDDEKRPGGNPRTQDQNVSTRIPEPESNPETNGESVVAEKKTTPGTPDRVPKEPETASLKKEVA